MDCLEYQSQFSAYLDGTLLGAERSALKSHLKTCLPCYRSWSSFQKTVGLLRQMPSAEPPEHLSALVFARINRRFGRGGPWLFADFHRWLPVGVGLAALLLVSIVLWRDLPLPLSRRTDSGDRHRSVVTRNQAAGLSSADYSENKQSSGTQGQVVVLRVEDPSRADRQLASLLESFAKPVAQPRELPPSLPSRAARLIHVQVSSQQYPRLIRELVKIGYLDEGQAGREKVAAPQHGRAIAVRIVVVTDREEIDRGTLQLRR